MAHRAVLFDLDGTLLDTLEDLADSMNTVLRRFGFPEHPVEPYKYFVGDGVDNLVLRTLPEAHRDPATVKRCMAAMRDEYAQRWADKTRPYAGIPELLDAVAARGLRMAVLSNKPDESTKLCVARLLPRWTFGLVAGVRPEGPKKPDPAGALAIAEHFGLAPADVLYLGDTNTDMQTAVAAGMFPVGALWGFRTADELLANGAKVLIEKPMDLLRLL